MYDILIHTDEGNINYADWPNDKQRMKGYNIKNTQELIQHIEKMHLYNYENSVELFKKKRLIAVFHRSISQSENTNHIKLVWKNLR
jgi:hypothetical protein